MDIMDKLIRILSSVLFLSYGSHCSPSTTGAPDMSLHLQCQEIEGSVCKGLGYNFTLFPNMLKHDTQLDALKDLQQFHPLLSIQCSAYLRQFLCMLYFPPCTILLFHLPPCRSLCLKARQVCDKQQKFPAEFDCDNFPNSQELLCHEPRDEMTNSSMAMQAQLFTHNPTEVTSQTTTMTPPMIMPDSKPFRCVNDTDCISGSRCRGEECVCVYPRTWGPLGCQMTQILGGPCSSTSECTAVTPNSICQDSICKCSPPLTSYKNLSCIHGSEFGSLCYNNAQCVAVNKFSFCRFLVAQVVGTCACDPDQFVSKEGKCVPRLGGRCAKGSCPKELGKASCKRSNTDGEYRCRCVKRALQESGVCLKIAKQIE